MSTDKMFGLYLIGFLIAGAMAVLFAVMLAYIRNLYFQPSPRQRVLAWLRANPGSHYGLDIAEACDVSRASIYVHLGRLEERGKVRREYEKTDRLGMPRTIYRAVENDEPPYRFPIRPPEWPANYNGPAPRDLPRPPPPPPPPSKR